MTFAACLLRLEQEGVIDRERAARFRSEYQRLNDAYGKRMGQAAAADMAGRDVLDALERKTMTERRQAMLQIQTQRGLLEQMADYIENGPDVPAALRKLGGSKARNFLTAVMESRDAGRGIVGVDNRRAALNQIAWSRMSGFLDKHRRDLLGRVRNGEELRDLVRELRGEASGNASARELAGAVSDTLEWLRQEFNAAGGDIAKLPNWGLPQSHDAVEIGTAGFETWRDFIKPQLAWEEMIDRETGKAFASEDALDEALEAAWKNITSEGMDGQIPGAFTGQGKVANRRMDHRFLVFRDADAWLAYNERFGHGDAFDAVVGHIDGMTHDIAAMQVLGPNPGLTVRWLADLATQDALPSVAGGKQVKLEANARRGAIELADMWDYYTGDLTSVPPEFRGMARFWSGLRNWNVAGKLGSAFLSAAPSDPVFMGITARFSGLPITRVLADYMRLMNPADASHRRMAEHAGLVVNELTSRAERMWREGRRFNAHELTRRGADATLRMSLLTPHTVASKQALGLGFMKDWAEAADRAFTDLDGADRMALQRYGIGPEDWDRLRSMAPHEQAGQRLLRPGDLARSGDKGLASAIKFMALVDAETRLGVPSNSLRAQAAVATLGHSTRLRRGTLGGELLISTMQFKTFSVIMLTTHLERAIYGQGGMSRAGYALALPSFLLLSGLLGTWLNDIATGKDLSPIDEPLTWGRAFARSGGVGIVGDLVTQGVAGERGMVGPVTGFLTGPTLATFVDPAVSLTLGNVGKAAMGEETNWQAEFQRQVKGMIPGGNIWYGRLALDRAWDAFIRERVDPNFGQAVARQERRAAEQGTAFYWRPGDPLSAARAPDFSNALGGKQPEGEGSMLQ